MKENIISNEISHNDSGTHLNLQNPNMQQGFNNPNIQQGFNNPNMQPGYYPNMQPGYNPNIQPGYNPNMQPGYNPNMQPGGINFFGDFKANYEQDNYINALSRSNFAFIKQKVELLEVLTGCETKNRYNVFVRNPDGSYVYLFKAKEDSGFCARQCCSYK